MKFTNCTVLLVALYFLAFGQAQQAPVFEAASVRAQQDNRGRSSMRGGPGTSDPSQIIFTNVTLMNVLLRAYDAKPYQIAGPEWLSSRRYDVVAKIPPGTTKEQFNLMLQNLLAERFHLGLHYETKEIQGYELTGKGGPKLKATPEAGADPSQPEPTSPPKTDANGFPQLDRPGLVMMEGVKGKAAVSFLTGKAQPVSALADLLSKEFRIPILDKTGLVGKFDFTLEFAPQPPGGLPPASSTEGLSDESGPNLLTAVQQQLGLKLNPRKIPVDVLIIDRADQVPTEN